MNKEQIIELIQISDKSILDIFRDAEMLWTSGIQDDEAIYIALKDYYLNGRETRKDFEC